jgi:glyoxylate reductase
MKKVFVTRKLLKENEEKLKELFDVKLNSNDKIYSAEEIIEGSKNFDGILSSVTDPINSDTIAIKLYKNNC